ncbi:hypothetical protein L226DRAFT_227359 [Lentinus tigrinus ALCF2SS1-7]|uniref:Uncharacterized protein n=1 Tax=Lentinus tigrinus ALCF2SS1-6 TaxID=1328759 RepID=A0A5C2S2X0_9APHY|nr:hypothetical protein L227DRAFT_201265 [Lentinus tigrinus ALCF2SS1-6]RPD70407.1 hypothetical protein L226DRAFT_227359 [Lentinus tigrinus ALCF2SS1-7]
MVSLPQAERQTLSDVQLMRFLSPDVHAPPCTACEWPRLLRFKHLGIGKKDSGARPGYTTPSEFRTSSLPTAHGRWHLALAVTTHRTHASMPVDPGQRLLVLVRVRLTGHSRVVFTRVGRRSYHCDLSLRRTTGNTPCTISRIPVSASPILCRSVGRIGDRAWILLFLAQQRGANERGQNARAHSSRILMVQWGHSGHIISTSTSTSQ